MQHGCVPLAFDSYPAARDIILPGKTGELIQPFNEQEYANKLISLAANPDDLGILAENAREHIKAFSPSKISVKWNVRGAMTADFSCRYWTGIWKKE